MNGKLQPSQFDVATIERFWSKVTKVEHGCWTWGNRANYGVFTAKGRTFLAHRVAMELSGRLTDRSLQVCHSCDNPPCCNPDHLWLGTNNDNIRDKMAKGRCSRVWPGRRALRFRS